MMMIESSCQEVERNDEENPYIPPPGFLQEAAVGNNSNNNNISGGTASSDDNHYQKSNSSTTIKQHEEETRDVVHNSPIMNLNRRQRSDDSFCSSPMYAPPAAVVDQDTTTITTTKTKTTTTTNNSNNNKNHKMMNDGDDDDDDELFDVLVMSHHFRGKHTVQLQQQQQQQLITSEGREPQILLTVPVTPPRRHLHQQQQQQQKHYFSSVDAREIHNFQYHSSPLDPPDSRTTVPLFPQDPPGQQDDASLLSTMKLQQQQQQKQKQVLLLQDPSGESVQFLEQKPFAPAQVEETTTVYTPPRPKLTALIQQFEEISSSCSSKQPSPLSVHYQQHHSPLSQQQQEQQKIHQTNQQHRLLPTNFGNRGDLKIVWQNGQTVSDNAGGITATAAKSVCPSQRTYLGTSNGQSRTEWLPVTDDVRPLLEEESEKPTYNFFPQQPPPVVRDRSVVGVSTTYRQSRPLSTRDDRSTTSFFAEHSNVRRTRCNSDDFDRLVAGRRPILDPPSQEDTVTTTAPAAATTTNSISISSTTRHNDEFNMFVAQKGQEFQQSSNDKDTLIKPPTRTQSNADDFDSLAASRAESLKMPDIPVIATFKATIGNKNVVSDAQQYVLQMSGTNSNASNRKIEESATILHKLSELSVSAPHERSDAPIGDHYSSSFDDYLDGNAEEEELIKEAFARTFLSESKRIVNVGDPTGCTFWILDPAGLCHLELDVQSTMGENVEDCLAEYANMLALDDDQSQGYSKIWNSVNHVGISAIEAGTSFAKSCITPRMKKAPSGRRKLRPSLSFRSGSTKSRVTRSFSFNSLR